MAGKLNYKALEYQYGNEMLVGTLAVSQKMGLDLMQNCDLPPPMKVFTGSHTTVVSSMNRVFSLMGSREEEGKKTQNAFDHVDDDDQGYKNDVVGECYDKLELLKALRLSQTRAREAEKKAATLAKAKDSLSKALIEEAKLLFAHRQWVRLLELQVSSFNSKLGLKGKYDDDDDDDDDDYNNNDGGRGHCITWVMALAFCLGIASVGFAFGCSRHLF